METWEVIQVGIFPTRKLLSAQDPHPDPHRSLETPELDALCEEWKIAQLKAQGVVVESHTGRLVEGTNSLGSLESVCRI